MMDRFLVRVYYEQIENRLFYYSCTKWITRYGRFRPITRIDVTRLFYLKMKGETKKKT